MTDRDKLLVSTEWLAARIGDSGISIVDGSWYLPTAGRDPAAEYRSTHIPGAVFFDIDAIADTASDLPHMLPSAAAFSLAAGALGLDTDRTIIVYDGAGLFSAARVWWTLKVFGARDVRILDGGVPKWTREGRPLESGEAKPSPRRFEARLDAASVLGLDEVRKAMEDGSAQIVDARPADRFRGDAPEPRPGLRSGHIPGSRSLPFGEVVADGRLKRPAEITALFEKAGIDPSRPVVTSCGSGVSAAVLALALETIGAVTVGLYDGSWAEWGGRKDTPVETGPR